MDAVPGRRTAPCSRCWFGERSRTGPGTAFRWLTDCHHFARTSQWRHFMGPFLSWIHRAALPGSRRKPVRRYSPLLEGLETRSLMAVTFRAIDGTGNNLLHPEWGSTDEQLIRIAPAEY